MTIVGTSSPRDRKADEHRPGFGIPQATGIGVENEALGVVEGLGEQPPDPCASARLVPCARVEGLDPALLLCLGKLRAELQARDLLHLELGEGLDDADRAEEDAKRLAVAPRLEDGAPPRRCAAARGRLRGGFGLVSQASRFCCEIRQSPFQKLSSIGDAERPLLIIDEAPALTRYCLGYLYARAARSGVPTCRIFGNLRFIDTDLRAWMRAPLPCLIQTPCQETDHETPEDHHDPHSAMPVPGGGALKDVEEGSGRSTAPPRRRATA